MNVDLEYRVKIFGEVPCGQNGLKSEETLMRDLPKFTTALLDLIAEEICCDSIAVTVEQIHQEEESLAEC